MIKATLIDLMLPVLMRESIDRIDQGSHPFWVWKEIIFCTGWGLALIFYG